MSGHRAFPGSAEQSPLIPKVMIKALTNTPRGELTFQELREALNIQQKVLGGKLGIKQAAVSRLERRSGMRLRYFKKAVEALGAELVIIARFPRIDVPLDVGRMD